MWWASKTKRHEDAAKFSQSLAQVEREQAAIRMLLESGAKSLTQVEGGFAENVASMKASLEAIQKRVAALQKQ